MFLLSPCQLRFRLLPSPQVASIKIGVLSAICGSNCGHQDGPDCKKKRARTDFRSAPEIAHFPPKIPAWLSRALDRLPPGDRSGRLRKWRGIKNMSERFSVCRSRLSSFVGDKLPLIFRFWKAIEVPFPAKWVQNRPETTPSSSGTMIFSGTSPASYSV